MNSISELLCDGVQMLFVHLFIYKIHILLILILESKVLKNRERVILLQCWDIRIQFSSSETWYCLWTEIYHFLNKQFVVKNVLVTVAHMLVVVHFKDSRWI